MKHHPLAMVCGVQLAVLLFLCTGCLWIGNEVVYSALLGGLLYILPNGYFTYYAFRWAGSHFAYGIVRSFYWGEAGKLALAAVGFALVFRFVAPLHIGALFSVFGLMIALQWLIAIRLTR